MRYERIRDRDLNQGPGDEYGKIQEGWEDTKRMGIYNKDDNIQEV